MTSGVTTGSERFLSTQASIFLGISKKPCSLPDRLALARAQKLDYAAFLTLILADEVQRRDAQQLERRLLAAGFEERPRRRLCPDHRHHHRGWLNARGDHWLKPLGD